jgi:hypothetical protein
MNFSNIKNISLETLDKFDISECKISDMQEMFKEENFFKSIYAKKEDIKDLED